MTTRQLAPESMAPRRAQRAMRGLVLAASAGALSSALLSGCGVCLDSNCSAAVSGSPSTPVGSVSGTNTGAVTATVSLQLTGPQSATTATDASGRYAFSGLQDGTYTLTPSLDGYTFTPASHSVTVSDDGLTGVDFVAAVGGGAPTSPTTSTHSISGTAVALDMSSIAYGGTALTLSGPTTATLVLGTAGTFTFSDLPDGDYTLSPFLAGFTFTPTEQQVTLSGQNVTGVSFRGVSTSCN